VGRWRRLQCNAGDFFDIFTTSVFPARWSELYPEDLLLSVTTTLAPEPSTWAMMLAGVASFGFLTCQAFPKTGRGRKRPPILALPRSLHWGGSGFPSPIARRETGVLPNALWGEGLG
jgi:hypothetical protein